MITIKVKDLELTLEEARELFEQLKEIFPPEKFIYNITKPATGGVIEESILEAMRNGPSSVSSISKPPKCNCPPLDSTGSYK